MLDFMIKYICFQAKDFEIRKKEWVRLSLFETDFRNNKYYHLKHNKLLGQITMENILPKKTKIMVKL